jgi:hypothetical protein
MNNWCTVDPRVTTALTYELVSFSLIPDTRVCGRNSGQCSAYIINFANCYQKAPPKARK